MAEHPYIESDLRAEAARYVGAEWDGLEVTAAMADRPPWEELSQDSFNEAFGRIMELKEGAVDVSVYSVDCGAEGLIPDGHRLVHGDEGGPVRAAFQIALDPHLELDPQAYDEIADAIRANLSFKGES